jgi:flagellar FliL protein
MKNMKLVVAVGVVALLAAGAAGGTMWYLGRPAAGDAAHSAHEEKAADVKPAKYLTLDKVIVMLRRNPGDAVSHYLSADLVVSTTADKEKECKEHLPLLRSVAVKALSGLPMAKAESMSIEQFAEELNKAFEATYARDKRERPFTEVMIGKLILE